MRTIKFRGLRVDGKGWVYGFPYINNGDCCIRGHGFYVDVIPESVGQFTGLKDKHGKDIFEGDIVRTWRTTGGISDKREGYAYGQVQFVNGKFGIFTFRFDKSLDGRFGENSIYGYPCYSVASQGVEVMGNIHENADLMK